MASDPDNDFNVVERTDLQAQTIAGVTVVLVGTYPLLQFSGSLSTDELHLEVRDSCDDLALEKRQQTLDILKGDHNIVLPFRISYQIIDSLYESFALPNPHLMLTCKNFYIYKLIFPTIFTCSHVGSIIRMMKEQMSNNINDLPAFKRSHNCDDLAAGWQLFALLSRLNSMNSKSKNLKFRISDANQGFNLCTSYPEKVIVPVNVTDENIAGSAKFRQGGRFPVVCFFYEAKQTFLLRSGQPLVTSMNCRSTEDELLLNFSAPMVADKKFCYIVDTRSQADATSDKVRGGGYESDSNYPNFHHFQRPLERVSNLLDSLFKFIKALRGNHSSVESYLSAVESSKWLDNVRSLIMHASLIFQILHREPTSVLVHGLEGRDTTLCVTTIAQVIADSNCRTIRGFQQLIHREWILAGHPFFYRHSSLFSQNKSRDSRAVAAPVFLLCLDAVWQFTRCFPTHFEFNENFLIFLAENSYSCYYGNFVCNNELERVSNAVFNKTQSLWHYLSQIESLSDFRNELYDPSRKGSMWFPVAPESFVPWTRFYLRKKNPFLSEMVASTASAKAMNRKLVSQASALTKEINKLQSRLYEKMGDC